jgi:signal transduction histidine kinase
MSIEPLPSPDPSLPTPHWEQLAAIFYHSSDGLFVMDDQLRIVVYNPAAAAMTGWAGPDPIEVQCRVMAGKACPVTEGSLFNPAECPGDEVLMGLRSSVSHEAKLVGSGGQEREVEVTYSPVRREDGTIRFILGVLRDIEDRKSLQEQLIQSKKLAALGTLVAGIAHELRNPLGIIRSAAEILSNEERTGPQRREATGLILEETRRLDKSIREFLSFARPRPARPEPTDVVGLLERAVALHSAREQGSRLKITERMEDGLPLVMLDADLIRQVFDNLLANAEEAKPDSEEGVALTISVYRADKRHVRIDFTDDGVGIEEDQLGRIYDPFFTTKRDGTGLGLSIVLKIVTEHRGRLQVASEPGAGTTFSVLLPAAEEGAR